MLSTPAKTSYRLWIALVFFFSITVTNQSFAQSADLVAAKKIIDSLDRKFAQLYLQGDSMGLYAMYAKDASLGNTNGPDILRVIGGWIRGSIKNNARHIRYITSSLMIDGGLIIELGVAEIKDDQGQPKGKGRYLVVWKQENQDWKLFRDIGL